MTLLELKSITHVLCYICLEGRGEEIYFIIIKMASVFKLPDVNVCVCGGGGGGGGDEITYILY